MKKIIPFLFLLSFPLTLSSQWYGDGTSASTAFYGVINGSYPLPSNQQWNLINYPSGIIYVGRSGTGENDLEVSNGGILTIGEGITVKFTQLTSDLFITGSGQITAIGSTSNKISFTKDLNEHWGHISFQNMSGTPASSKFDECIFEYGYSVGSSSQPLLAGGVLQVDFNDVVIEDCIFRYNYSNFGGAIIINSNRNTTIRNSYFLSNDAFECGGALLLYAGTTSIVENCIFEDNYAKGNNQASYSGGAIWSYLNTSKIVNCTFVENNSDRAGDAIYSYSSPDMRIINSIFWGSNDQFAGTSNTSTIVTCAFEIAKPANATNSIIITDIASDHFVDAGSSNWTLRFSSPCRDAGIGSYPGITIPSTDYLYLSRIQTVDIGAYEVQYSRWTGAAGTSWSESSNWEANIDPSKGSGDVIIPAGLSSYPVSPSNPGFTIGTGKQMILSPGALVTLSSLVNNGSLRLESDASNISSLIVGSYSGNGATIELYLTGGEAGSKNYRWHYISTPVSSLPVSIFTPVTPDVVRYYDSRVTTDLVQGWVAQDGWIYATGSFGGPTFTTLTPGLGYDFYDSANNEFTFSGQLNTSDVPVILDYAGGANNGFNLLGNPFSSGLDWDYIISQPNYPTNTSKGLYFTRNNSLCSYIAGVGIPSDVNGYIPPMQGFFTKTYATGKTITLTAAAKTHSAHARYKGTGTIPLIRLSLTDDILSDETVIRFDEKASASLDYDFDALKIFYSSENTAIYSVSEGSKYVINGQPFPDTTLSIPVGVNLLASGIHTITTTQLQGLDTYGVYLKDNVTGFTADLKTNPVVTFTASAGSVPDRFILKISNYTTGISESNISRSLFNIYYGFGSVNIQTLADERDGIPGSVTIFDMTGKKVHELRNVEFVKNSIISLSSPDSKGIYVVEIKSGMKRYTEKVVIK